MPYSFLYVCVAITTQNFPICFQFHSLQSILCFSAKLISSKCLSVTSLWRFWTLPRAVPSQELCQNSTVWDPRLPTTWPSTALSFSYLNSFYFKTNLCSDQRGLLVSPDRTVACRSPPVGTVLHSVLSSERPPALQLLVLRSSSITTKHTHRDISPLPDFLG